MTFIMLRKAKDAIYTCEGIEAMLYFLERGSRVIGFCDSFEDAQKCMEKWVADGWFDRV